jgi:hypothetical protein
MNHGLTQVFGAGLAPHLKKRGLMACPVILENERMIHGEIRRTMLKVTDWIATRGHHVAQELVSIREGAAGAVNEPGLNSGPGLDESRTIARGQRPDVHGLHVIGAFVKQRLCFPLAPAFFHGAGILSAAKLSAESLRPAFPGEKRNGDACGQHHNDCGDYGDLCRA